MQVILQPTSTENLTPAQSAKDEFDTHLIDTHTSRQGSHINKHTQDGKTSGHVHILRDMFLYLAI